MANYFATFIQSEYCSWQAMPIAEGVIQVENNVFEKQLKEKLSSDSSIGG